MCPEQITDQSLHVVIHGVVSHLGGVVECKGDSMVRVTFGKVYTPTTCRLVNSAERDVRQEGVAYGPPNRWRISPKECPRQMGSTGMLPSGRVIKSVKLGN